MIGVFVVVGVIVWGVGLLRSAQARSAPPNE